MVDSWRKHRCLHVGVLILMALFVATTVACGAFCQIKPHQNGHSAFQSPCCHVTGGIYASPVIPHIEPLTAYFQGLVHLVPALLIFTIFHPPHV